MKEEHKGYLFLILYSLLNGLLGMFVKLVRGMSAYSILFSRAFIVVCTLGLFMIITRKTKELRLQFPSKTALVGVFQGASVLLYFLALQRTTISNAVFLVYSAPVFSILLSWIFLKERIVKATIIGVIFSMIGILFLFDPRSLSFDVTKNIGNMFALGSGFLYAAMAVAAKPITKKISGRNIVFWQYLVISILFLPFIRPAIGTQFLSNWWQLLSIGVLCTAIAFILFMEGVKRIPGQKVFILTSLEPVVGTIAGLVVLGEVPSIFTFVGAFLILIGVFIVTKKS